MRRGHEAAPALLGTRAALVPRSGGAGRALVAVIASLAFLAALAALLAVVFGRNAAAWSGAVLAEATIQVRSVPGRDQDRDLADAAALARAAPGVRAVRVVTREEQGRLLEPWLGDAAGLADLPIPRMLVLSLATADAGTGDRGGAGLDDLARRVAAAVPTAAMDTHRQWSQRLAAVAAGAAAAAVATVAIVLAATAGAVAFATLGALASHRDTVEVLHWVGASDAFVARLFARRFAAIGLAGGALGAGAAALLVLALGRWAGGGGDEALGALFGAASPGASGWLAVAAVVVCESLLAAAIAAVTVKRFLKRVG